MVNYFDGLLKSYDLVILLSHNLHLTRTAFIRNSCNTTRLVHNNQRWMILQTVELELLSDCLAESGEGRRRDAALR